ncbi:methyl-accepting chemotaxis sensory transducer [Caldicellulosiruptor owensensis OL]|uniref:Methyl-accepting chemotaxis sensory transducer n=1 Tax=Caldicellulosiruptor owensensis (strain ATCC 700167 / DSM 13100 / OL) TaxID=632518 RepID=E4Q3Z6_CALOW|nr:methyl-accepting chemotaxis protein [Caldicellulosiruptor owensensis]ADQ04031.1 methyl-accepting chemotaxis sensory transducer [Caldicellulosiruptor owensensis OL]
MAWYIYAFFILMLIVIVAEGFLIVKKSKEIQNIIYFMATRVDESKVSKEFINLYKNRIQMIEKPLKDEIYKLRAENESLKDEIEKSNFKSYRNEIYQRFKTLFMSLGEVMEAFKMVLDEINEALIKNLEDMNIRSTTVESELVKGKNKISKSVEDINLILNQMRDLSKDVLNLSNHIEKMERVAGIINDIVKEISFISLNAQIEANKMKDSLTFGLLASEMRKLADGGKQNLKEISKSMANVVDDINANNKKIENFVNRIEELENSTREITDEIDSLSNLISSVLKYQEELYNQIKQHFAGIQEIVGVLENIHTEAVQIVEQEFKENKKFVNV